jgi:hypothetical protein
MEPEGAQVFIDGSHYKQSDGKSWRYSKSTDEWVRSTKEPIEVEKAILAVSAGKEVKTINRKAKPREMPKYTCLKQVRALQIRKIIQTDTGSILEFHRKEGKQGYADIAVSNVFMGNYSPFVNGYFIVDGSGNRSFMSKEAFESGYKRSK